MLIDTHDQRIRIGTADALYHSAADAAEPIGDAELVRRYVTENDSAGFAVLLRRHGPTVLGVCRRGLGDSPDADDAFQAVFLVLMRKAATLKNPDRLSSWLFGVALRTVAKMKRMHRTRSVRERPLEIDPPTRHPQVESEVDAEQLDQEIQRLPRKFRDPLILCGIRGLTIDQTARQLGLPVGTAASRLSRGRNLLRKRLAGRGVWVAVSGGVGVSMSTVSTGWSAQVPALLHTAVLNLLGGSVRPSVSIDTVARGVMKEMKPFPTTATLIGACLLAGAIGTAVVILEQELTSADPRVARNSQADPPRPKVDPKPPIPDRPDVPEFPGLNFRPDLRDAFVDRKEEPLDPSVVEIVRGNRQFAFDAFARAGDQKGNFMLSPISLSSGLTLLSLGTAGNTEAQLLKTLHQGAREKVHPAYGLLQKELNRSAGDDFTLRTANALFGRNGEAWKETYLTQSLQWHGSRLISADFDDPAGAKKVIDQWVSEKTDRLINDSIPISEIGPATRMVLVNTALFKAKWVFDFDPKLTKPAPFQGINGVRDVPMMRMSATPRLFYADFGDGHAISLPYGKAIEPAVAEMVILLPKKADGCRELEKKLTAEWWDRVHKVMEPSQIDLQLPRFKFETTTVWTDRLKQLGITDAFEPSKADFTPMLDKPLFLGPTLQKTIVDVDEIGTKAAAATIMMALGGVSEPKKIVCDRPFLFIIRDLRTESILFMGRYADPPAK